MAVRVSVETLVPPVFEKENVMKSTLQKGEICLKVLNKHLFRVTFKSHYFKSILFVLLCFSTLSLSLTFVLSPTVIAAKLMVIPADTGSMHNTITVPANHHDPEYQVSFNISEVNSTGNSVDFGTSDATVLLTVTKYDPYGTIVNQTTVDYEWMKSNLTVYGDGATHYYHQGPTFDVSTHNALWNPEEMINVDSRDYGRLLGTDLKNLCDLVGGASHGDTVKVKAFDNFSKLFDYEDIYNPEPEQGKLIVCWYNKDHGGYVPNYTTGMRLVFFAETQSPEMKYVFGDWDMHETLPASRWHFYYDGDFWPSSSGLSVQHVYNIEIHQPNLVSCDSSGSPKESFCSEETVYVTGLGLSPFTSYKIWIQNEPTLLNPLDSLDRPSGTSYIFNSSNDPSGIQETITTDSNGDFSTTAIWNIPSEVPEADYDIAADNQSSGTVGTYESSDAIDSPGWQGFSVSVVEYISFTVTTYDTNGIVFGDLQPGQTGHANCSSSQGPITITVCPETNVAVDIQMKGDEFAANPSSVIPVENVSYSDNNNPSETETLTDSYVTWYTVGADTYNQREVYYWINIPPAQIPGNYTSSFYYKAVSSS